MSLSRRTTRRALRRRLWARRERGTAILEFAIIAPLFFLLLFGIISFGYILAFAQNVTQAANEGARAGAVALPDPTLTVPIETRAEDRARQATESAVASFDQTCNTGAMSCQYVVANCDATGATRCITVTVRYDYDQTPLLPKVPGLGMLYPSDIVQVATAQINPTSIGAPAPGPTTTTTTAPTPTSSPLPSLPDPSTSTSLSVPELSTTTTP